MSEMPLNTSWYGSLKGFKIAEEELMREVAEMQEDLEKKQEVYKYSFDVLPDPLGDRVVKEVPPPLQRPLRMT